jgi:hypothetical protein
MAQDADVEITDARPRKKIRSSTQRKRATSPIHHPRAPQLFAPFRALGLITNHIPFYLQTRSYKDATDGPRIHILTCLGRSWALWEGGKMGLLFVGESCMSHVRKHILFSRAMLHRSGSPRPYFLPSHGWRCCLGSIWHTCDQISPRQRGKSFRDPVHSSVADIVIGFTYLESTPDSLSICCSIWRSVACIDGRWRANADMGYIDEWFAFCSVIWVVLSNNTSRTGALCKPSI